MAETRVNNYEAMFLLSQAQAAEFGGAVNYIRTTLEKGGATIIAMRKWDERRLAFEIDKQKRGIYILCYFSANAQAVGPIERSFNLGEQVMRQLIIRADHLSLDEMKAADGSKELEAEAKLRATQPQAVPAPAAEDRREDGVEEDEA
jgi:small subunit ribosomal protein S6